MPWCEIAKNKVAEITCAYFGDKSQKFAPAEKTSYTVYTDCGGGTFG